jgi:hypothetical protein
MKQINYFLATIMIALIPMLVSSCKPQVEPDSIVGKWELVEATRVVKEIPGAGADLNDLVGQVWSFGVDGKLVVGMDACDYTLADAILNTTYAKQDPFLANYFVVQTRTEKDLVLTATYEKKDNKMGDKRTYVITLKFVRIVE